jgi:hypothetical protein
VGAYIQGRSQLDIERLKFESSVILKAIETGDREESRKNLAFVLQAGLIKDPGHKIAALIEHADNIPVLPAPISIDVETMRLKRLMDERSQTSDALRQLRDERARLEARLHMLSAAERDSGVRRHRTLVEEIGKAEQTLRQIDEELSRTTTPLARRIIDSIRR